MRTVQVLLGCVLAAATLAMAGPEALNVQVRSGQLRSSPSFLGAVVKPLAYGERVAVTGKQGDWIGVACADGRTGWVHGSALTKKVVVMRAGAEDVNAAASGAELALASKGFNSDVEAQFKARNRNADFAAVDRMESIKVAAAEVQAFLQAGAVQPAAGGRP